MVQKWVIISAVPQSCQDLFSGWSIEVSALDEDISLLYVVLLIFLWAVCDCGFLIKILTVGVPDLSGRIYVLLRCRLTEVSFSEFWHGFELSREEEKRKASPKTQRTQKCWNVWYFWQKDISAFHVDESNDSSGVNRIHACRKQHSELMLILASSH